MVAYIFPTVDTRRQIHLPTYPFGDTSFFGTASAVLFSWRGGGLFPCSACRRSWRSFAVLRGCAFAVSRFSVFFCPFSARFRCRRVFVRPSCFRAFLPRFRACFGVLRVCRSVIRCDVSVLRLFLSRSRRFLARLVQSIKAIKKARFRGNFQGVFAFVRSGVMRLPLWSVSTWRKRKRAKPSSLAPWSVFFILLFLAIERNCARRLASSICNRSSRHSLANYNQ